MSELRILNRPSTWMSVTLAHAKAPTKGLLTLFWQVDGPKEIKIIRDETSNFFYTVQFSTDEKVVSSPVVHVINQFPAGISQTEKQNKNNKTVRLCYSRSPGRLCCVPVSHLDLSLTSLDFLNFILVASLVNKVQLYYMIYYTAKNCILQFLKLIQESFLP